ncbi:MAG TPA: GNAT family N-acetyltransferase [Chloroflexota bacterium]
MSMKMPVLVTERLLIRPFTLDDLDPIHRILAEVAPEVLHVAPTPQDVGTLEARRAWLEWSIANERELANLLQPPYGDRAVVRRADDVLVGACGFVPELKPFGRLPSFPRAEGDPARFVPQVGLFWTIGQEYRRNGYATEAGRAMIDYAFGTLRLAQIVATTDDDNAASIGVMRKLGMRLERNPHSEPAWFQMCGVLENRADFL